MTHVPANQNPSNDNRAADFDLQKFTASRRKRNYALLVILFSFIFSIYFITIFKLGANLFK